MNCPLCPTFQIATLNDLRAHLEVHRRKHGWGRYWEENNCKKNPCMNCINKRLMKDKESAQYRKKRIW